MTFNPNAYLEAYGDVQKAYSSLAKKGTLRPGEGEYFQTFGNDVSEPDWLNLLNKKYGRNAKDVGEYTANEYATAHFDTYGKGEGRDTRQQYKDAVRRTSNNPGGSAANLDDATVPLDDFQALLDRLEGSKKRQQRQKSVEGRRDIYSQGLASMMGNF